MTERQAATRPERPNTGSAVRYSGPEGACSLREGLTGPDSGAACALLARPSSSLGLTLLVTAP